MSLETYPATVDRFDDLRTILGPKDPQGRACWCLAYRISSGDERLQQPGARPAIVRELCAGEVAPGVLAYRDGEVVGWCSVSPRSSYARLARSRVIPRVDDLPVWSVVCFVVRPGHRGQGVAQVLLEGAVGFAADGEATVVEGYPADPGEARLSRTLAYTGTRSMFERAGFVKVADTSSQTGGVARVVMRKDLTRTAR